MPADHVVVGEGLVAVWTRKHPVHGMASEMFPHGLGLVEPLLTDRATESSNGNVQSTTGSKTNRDGLLKTA